MEKIYALCGVVFLGAGERMQHKQGQTSFMTYNRDFTFYFLLAFSCLPLISVLLPRFMTFCPSLVGLAGYAYLAYARGQTLPLSRSYLYISLGIGALCALSALSSENPKDVLEKAFLTTLLLLSCVFLLAVCRSLEPEKLNEHSWVFPLLLMLAALVASFELFFKMPLYQLLHAAPEGRKINTAEINRGAVNIVLCSFGAFSLLQLCGTDKRRRLLSGLALATAIVLMLALSQAQVAQLSFFLGLGLYFLYPASWKPGYRILTTLVCLLLLTAPWLAQWMFAALAADAQTLPWLKSGYAGARMEIWDFTSRYALQSPLTGHGMDATRSVESFDHARLYHREDSVLHPHNFALQLWVDFGLIGALCGSALISYLFMQIRRLDPIVARPAITILLLTLLVAAISYGLWQSHWIGVMLYLLSLSQIIYQVSSSSSESRNIRQI